MNKLAWTIVLLIVNLAASAQLKVMPIIKQGGEKTTPAAKTSFVPLTLPFWDDFSGVDLPDSGHWVNSGNVLINNGLSFVPPSLGVVSFDGLDSLGNPYGAGSASGLTDSLNSRPFDLSSYSFADEIFLSFFYQAGGLGDLPNEDDSLQLEFLNASGEWVIVWPDAVEVEKDRKFHQVMLPITNEEFFHENFRFRFTSVGNVSGMFDIWNLDYIYMNTNRFPADTSYTDRSVNEPLSAFLENYFAVPYTHFTMETSREPTFWVRNLVTVSPNFNRAYKYLFNYQIDVTDSLGMTTSFSNSTEVDPIESPIRIGTTEEVTLREPVDDFSKIPGADSAYVFLEIVLDAEDNKPISEGGDYDPSKYAPIDFRQNDTVRMEYNLTNYYAYDDGTAEAAAGLNFAGDRLAYRFVQLLDTADFITAVDMYFPFTGTEPAGKSIDITVWDESGGIPGEVLHREPTIIQRPGGLNEFVRYQFSKPVAVADTFFIGYRQNNNGALGLGLDRNNLTTGEMLFNLDALWETNSLVQGSLMMRPVFGTIDTVVGIDDDIAQDIQVFPNPSRSGIFRVNIPLSDVVITDILGREFSSAVEVDGSNTFVDLSNHPPGLYILSGRTLSGELIQEKLLRK